MKTPDSVYRHIIFDFDGVLCDSLPHAILAANSIREEHFEELPPVETKEDMAYLYRGALSTCLHRWISGSDARRFFDLHSAAMSSIRGELGTYPGIGSLFDALPPGSASIVTSAYSDSVKDILSGDGIDMSSIYTVAGRELGQPKSTKIRNILDELSLDKKDVVYVGDLQSDILYCRDVPVDIISVGYGYHTGEYLRELSPHFYVDSVGELQDLVGRVLST